MPESEPPVPEESAEQFVTHAELAEIRKRLCYLSVLVMLLALAAVIDAVLPL
ncbi:hypothetical protein [Streptomyces sp. NPDC097619]|uniref:hypothetical protein n=1 Tax=Streptomyces sp. NPDC097619 TaxID=3157228 RepID=UPI0033174428